MGILIDTSVLINLERGRVDLEAVTSLAPASISVITTSELLHGTHRAADERTRERRRGFVEQVLDAFEPLPITNAIARTRASIWAAVSHRPGRRSTRTTSGSPQPRWCTASPS